MILSAAGIMQVYDIFLQLFCFRQRELSFSMKCGDYERLSIYLCYTGKIIESQAILEEDMVTIRHWHFSAKRVLSSEGTSTKWCSEGCRQSILHSVRSPCTMSV